MVTMDTLTDTISLAIWARFTSRKYVFS